MHAWERVWSKGFLVLKVHIILRPNQVAKLWSYDNVIMCGLYLVIHACAWLMHTVRKKWWFVSINFTHTRIAFQLNALVRPFDQTLSPFLGRRGWPVRLISSILNKLYLYYHQEISYDIKFYLCYVNSTVNLRALVEVSSWSGAGESSGIIWLLSTYLLLMFAAIVFFPIVFKAFASLSQLASGS